MYELPMMPTRPNQPVTNTVYTGLTIPQPTMDHQTALYAEVGGESDYLEPFNHYHSIIDDDYLQPTGSGSQVQVGNPVSGGGDYDYVTSGRR